MRRTLCCSLFAMLIVTRVVGAESVFVESVFPPSLKRGEVNRITLRGSQLSGAIGLWTTTPAIGAGAQLLEIVDHETTFEVVVAQDARLGLYGLRLATRDGLSNVHLFVIDDVRQVAEAESVEPNRSNNKRHQAQEVSLPAAIFGTCTDTDDDYFAINVAAGERVSFEVVGNRLGKGFDPVVVIYRENGEFLVEHDNDAGLFFDCRFEHAFPTAGRYIVRLRDTQYQGSEHWTYVLRMGRFPVARVALPSTAKLGEASLIAFPQGDCDPREVTFPTELTTERFFYDLRGDDHDAPTWVPLFVSSLDNAIEVEPNDALDSATITTVPCNLHGMMNRRRDVDFFTFELRQGQRLEFRADTRDSGSAADLELTLFGPDGKTLKTVDDVGFDDATFEFYATVAGRYVLKVVEVVRKYGPEYVYRVEVREREPGIQLTSEIARLAIPQGTWQPLPLKLARKDFGEEVTLSLIGAPPGMKLRETSITSGATEFTGAISVDPSTPQGIYTLQVAATGMNGDRELRCIARTQPLVDRLPTGRGPHGEPFELRKDQCRLPPSLTDRIAVVVLPPSPYDFEITTPSVILPRFMQTVFHIETTRDNEFDAPIQFVARGGQLEANRLQKPSVTTEIPDATVLESGPAATLHSGVNTNLTKHRVTVTGTTRHGERTIHLTRTFELEVKVAFDPTAEPAQLKLHPGETAVFRLLANRLAPFSGKLMIQPSQTEGIELADELVIGADQDAIDVKLTLAADIKPGSYKIKLPAETRIGKFFEAGGANTLEVLVQEKAAAPTEDSQ